MNQIPNINPKSNNLPVLPFDHKEPEDDDCGLPESPIYSNYVKHLWRRLDQNPNTRRLAESPEREK